VGERGETLKMSWHCFIHLEKIELFGYGPNYRIELSELKPNVSLNRKLNISESQVNRYLESCGG
jgi:hypothetical protein